MRLSWLRRQFGGAPVSVLALTLLVFGCVFVAVAGPGTACIRGPGCSSRTSPLSPRWSKRSS